MASLRSGVNARLPRRLYSMEARLEARLEPYRGGVYWRQTLKRDTPSRREGVFADRLNHDASLASIQLLVNKTDILRQVVDDRLGPEQREQLKRGEWTPNSATLARITLTKHYRHAVTFLRYIKAGITHVWANYWVLRREVARQFYVLDNSLVHERPTGRERTLAVGVDAGLITDALANHIHNAKKRNHGLFRQHDFSRSMYQAVLRTRRDFYKLPVFAALFALLEEALVPLLYVFPGLAPSTCVLPQLHARYYAGASRAQKLLAARAVAKTSTPYTLASDELRLVAGVLRVSAWTERALREALAARWKQLLVDNYLILRDGGVLQLSNLELLDACIQRGLLDFDELVRMGRRSDLNLYDAVAAARPELVARLAVFLNECELPGVSVGLAATPPPPTAP